MKRKKIIRDNPRTFWEPDSGTGQLVDLAGKMVIKTAERKYPYDFEYTLADTP
jgi:hypothetical protein